MAEKKRTAIEEHGGELDREATIRKFRIVRMERFRGLGGEYVDSDKEGEQSEVS